MREEEPPGSKTCDEYAVYEQALHALLQMGQGEAIGTSVPALRGNNADLPQPPPGKWAPEALRWLGCRMGPVTIRA
jgi:hypothetical protein